MGCANGNTAQNVLNGSGLSDFTACSSATIYRVFCPVFLTGTTDASLDFFSRLRLPSGNSLDRTSATAVSAVVTISHGSQSRGTKPTLNPSA